VFVGFPLGGLLAFALMLTSASVFHPDGRVLGGSPTWSSTSRTGSPRRSW
jgi:hypothetical protein